MKQRVAINNIREDKAILMADKYNELKRQLESINVHMDGSVIEYDDCFTDPKKINDILQNVFEIKI